MKTYLPNKQPIPINQTEFLLSQFRNGDFVLIKFGGNAMEKHHKRVIWRPCIFIRCLKKNAEIKVISTSKIIKRKLEEIYTDNQVD